MGNKPPKLAHEQRVILLIQGFNRYLTRLQTIRPTASCMDEINDICFQFYLEKTDQFDKIGDNIKLYAAKQTVACASKSLKGLVNTCYGHNLIESVDNNKVYTWKFRILAKSSYWAEDGDGICIGIAEQNLNALNDDLSSYSTVTQYYYCSNGDTHTYSKWNRRKNRWSTVRPEIAAIGPIYNPSDIITMVLDMKNRNLRFCKNDIDTGICYNNILQAPQLKYKLAVYLFGDYTGSSSIQLLESSISGYIDNTEGKNDLQNQGKSKENDKICIDKNILIEKYTIYKALVLVICISKYNKQYDDLDGCKIDKQNMINLWRDQYKYDVIFNKNNKVEYVDFIHYLNECRSVLGKKENKDKYSGLITIFSCHGDSKNLICSDGKTISRTKITQWFNGDNVPFMIYKPKIIIMDACRGGPYNFPNIIPKNIIYKGTGDDEYHPDEQIILLYSTTNGYAVADDAEKGGNLIRTIYTLFSNDDNINKNHLDDLFKVTQKEVKTICAAYQCIEQRNLGNDSHIFLKKNL